MLVLLCFVYMLLTWKAFFSNDGDKVKKNILLAVWIITTTLILIENIS